MTGLLLLAALALALLAAVGTGRLAPSREVERARAWARSGMPQLPGAGGRRAGGLGGRRVR